MSQEQVKTSVSKQEQVKTSVPEYIPPFNNGKDVAMRLPKFKPTKICLKPIAVLVDGEPGVTKPDFSDQVDVQSIVDQNAESTGVAYALRQINAGRLMPAQLADNGKGGVDLSNVADNINDAHAQMIESGDAAKKVQEELGLGFIDPSRIEEYVTKAINERISALQAQSKKEGE